MTRAPHSPTALKPRLSMDAIQPVTEPRPSRRLGHIWRKLAACGLSLTVLLSFAAPAGATGFNAALAASKTTSSSGTLQLKATTGTTNCYSTGSGSGGVITSNSATCSTGSPIPSGSLSATTAAAATTTLSSVGTANASGGTVSSASCGVAQLSDIVGGDTALAVGGLTYQSSGPLGSQAITVDGSTGWAETTTSYNDPEGFTVIVWFNTTKATGGIMGFGSQVNPTTGTPADHDRQLWIDPSGKLVWGVYSNAVYQLTSTSPVDTGNWVMAVASVGAAGHSPVRQRGQSRIFHHPDDGPGLHRMVEPRLCLDSQLERRPQQLLLLRLAGSSGGRSYPAQRGPGFQSLRRHHPGQLYRRCRGPKPN